MSGDPGRVNDLVDHLFRREAGRIASRLTRVFGPHRLDLVEDAVQYALLQALQHWPYQGVPDNTHAWLTRVASNRALDVVRADQKLRSIDADDAGGLQEEVEALSVAAGQDQLKFAKELEDEQLALMFVCCHPALPRAASVALTLKVVCGFGVAEIARAFLTNETTIAQRLVRAKRLIRDQRIGFEVPGPQETPARVDPVLEVLYLFFTEGLRADRGRSPDQGRSVFGGDPSHRAARRQSRHRATRMSCAARADAVSGGAFCFSHRFRGRSVAARRTGPLALEPLDDFARDVAHGSAAAGERLTSYHLQAEIAAIHVATEQPQARRGRAFSSCTILLREMQPSAVVLLNRAIALGKVEGPAAGLAALKSIAPDAGWSAIRPCRQPRGVPAQPRSPRRRCGLLRARARARAHRTRAALHPAQAYGSARRVIRNSRDARDSEPLRRRR
jgi:RNA polymerase sigma-70 factor (ECF subfamily)